MVSALFWGTVLLSLLLAFAFARKTLKRPALKDFKLKRFGRIVGALILSLIVLYIIFALLGQAQRGYIGSICFALASLFSIIAFVAGDFLKRTSSSLLRANLLSMVLSASLSLAGIALLFDFFSIWNELSKLPFLLTGYGIGAALSAFLLRQHSDDTNHDIFAFFSLIMIAGIITSGSSAVLVIGALGVLGCILSIFITDKRWFPGLFLAHVFGIVAVAVGAFYLGMMRLVFAGMVGTLFSLLAVPVILFYTDRKFRPAKSISKGYVAGVMLETALVPVILIVAGFVLSYVLGISAGDGWLGVAFASFALLSQSVFITAFSSSGDRADSVSRSYMVLCAAATLLLVFAAYHTQMSSLIGSAAWIINLSKVEVLAGLFVGGFIALSCAAVSLSRELNGIASLLIALIVSFLAGFALKAEAAAAIVAGAFLVGIPLAWSMAISKINLSDKKFEIDSVSASIVFAASLMLLIAPLLI